jgi:trimeric autotransporter adhesin
VIKKKVVLSVLSTAVVTSMAASALAAPKAGIYIGGDVDKYYSFESLTNSSNVDKLIDDLIDTSANGVYVNQDGVGGYLADLLFAENPEEQFETVTNDYFAQIGGEDGFYTVNEDGTVSDTKEPADPDNPVNGELKVKSVSAINAKQIEIKFSKAVKKDTVISGTDSLSSNISVTPLGSATATTVAKAELSTDGKTLTLTAASKFNGEYAVTVNTNVVDVDGKAIKAYSSILNVEDTVRPTVKSVEYVDNATAKVWFSEPLSSIGTASVDNSATVTTSTYSQGYITVDLSNSPAATDVTLTVIGAKDFNDNLISPNPAKVVLKKDISDTVKPTVTNIVAVSDKVFKVTFSEKLKANPTVTIDGNTVGETPSVDETGLVYTYTLASAVSNGLHTVAVTSYVDKSNNQGTPFSKVVNFVKDTIPPTVASTRVEKINGVEHLVVTFNEDVTPSASAVTITGTKVADFVETPVTFSATPALYGNSKNTIQISLAGQGAGSYNVTLPAGTVTDLSGNAMVAKNGVTFTRTADFDPNKPALKATVDGNGIVKGADNNTYLVHFNKQLDATSALDLNNYVIEGATVQSAIFTQNDATNGAIVKLTLVPGSVTLTGDRQVTIKNVKSAAGVAMDTVTTIENFTENVAPTVSAAITAPDTITLTFSEEMNASTITDSDADFAVYVDGVDWETVAGATYGTVTEAAYGTDNKVFTLKLGRDLTADEYAKAIEVKAAATLNATDANGNKLNITTVNVVK